MTFSPEHTTEPSVTLSNVNAVDLVLWLGYARSDIDRTPGLLRLPAKDLAARCRRRLWPERRNFDTARPDKVDRRLGAATFIDCGRPAGYLRQTAERLLMVADAAGDGFVVAL